MNQKMKDREKTMLEDFSRDNDVISGPPPDTRTHLYMDIYNKRLNDFLPLIVLGITLKSLPSRRLWSYLCMYSNQPIKSGVPETVPKLVGIGHTTKTVKRSIDRPSIVQSAVFVSIKCCTIALQIKNFLVCFFFSIQQIFSRFSSMAGWRVNEKNNR